MLVPMVKVQILGRRAALEPALERLYALRRVQLVDVETEPDIAVEPAPVGVGERARQDELTLLLARVEGMLALISPSELPAPLMERGPEPARADLDALRRELDGVAPAV
jgi:hypothetical protein